MKKIIVTLAFACVATFVQAASCAWGTPNVLDSSLNLVTCNYFLVSLKGNSTAGIAVDKSGALVDANSAISNVLVSSTFWDKTAVGPSGERAGLTESDNGTYWALIVVDASNTFYGISDAEVLADIKDDPVQNASIKFSNYTDEYGEAMQLNTATVPEPTVLALLALGVAGLALRRRA